MIRTGAQYIASLKDDRTVYVNGERVADVTEHPAFSAAVRSIGHLYDLAASPEHREVMTFRVCFDNLDAFDSIFGTKFINRHQLIMP